MRSSYSTQLPYTTRTERSIELRRGGLGTGGQLCWQQDLNRVNIARLASRSHKSANWIDSAQSTTGRARQIIEKLIQGRDGEKLPWMGYPIADYSVFPDALPAAFRKQANFFRENVHALGKISMNLLGEPIDIADVRSRQSLPFCQISAHGRFQGCLPSDHVRRAGLSAS